MPLHLRTRKTVFVIIENSNPKAKDLKIGLCNHWLSAKLPDKSWNTLVIPSSK